MVIRCEVLAGDTTRPPSTIAKGYAPPAVTATCAGAGEAARGVVSFEAAEADGFEELDAGGRIARSLCAGLDDASLDALAAGVGLTAGSLGETGSSGGGAGSPRATAEVAVADARSLVGGALVRDAESLASGGRSVVRECERPMPDGTRIATAT